MRVTHDVLSIKIPAIVRTVADVGMRMLSLVVEALFLLSALHKHSLRYSENSGAHVMCMNEF